MPGCQAGGKVLAVPFRLNISPGGCLPGEGPRFSHATPNEEFGRLLTVLRSR